MLSIRPTTPSDAALLPGIEHSSGQIFRTVMDLAWIADDGVMPAAAHVPLIVAGTSWVAHTADEIIGFVCGEIMVGTLPLHAPLPRPALHIWQIAVARPFQGHGAGTALLLHAIEHARAMNLAGLSLTTFRNVAWNAPFYQRIGFRGMEEKETPPALKTLLAHEAALGMPMDQRCAMALLFSTSGPKDKPDQAPQARG